MSPRKPAPACRPHRPTAPPRPLVRCLALALIPAFCASAQGVRAWTGTLPDGAQVHVDPATRRATRVDGDSAVPLWDGVHRLDDGTVVIVREGTAIPSAPMLDAWEGAAPEQETLAGRPCELLVRRACGRENDCASAPDCVKARQLLNLEREEQRRAPIAAGPHPATAAGNRCGAALVDPAPIPCRARPAPAAPGPCDILVERVCGADRRCAGAPACGPARQLQTQASAERAAALDPAGPTPSDRQCGEALGIDFFSPCPGDPKPQPRAPEPLNP